MTTQHVRRDKNEIIYPACYSLLAHSCFIDFAFFPFILTSSLCVVSTPHCIVKSILRRYPTTIGSVILHPHESNE